MQGKIDNKVLWNKKKGRENLNDFFQQNFAHLDSSCKSVFGNKSKSARNLKTICVKRI